MISRKHQCIFIHIPKTAGTSIETTLGYHGDAKERGRQDHRRLRNVEQAIWPPKRRRYLPADFVHFANQRISGRNRGFDFVTYSEYGRFFKFAIVRNPWDRVHSWYRNVIRDPFHQKQLGISADCSFVDFVKNHLDCWALNPQIDWLVDEQGDIALDYIGKFETLGISFIHICKSLGLENQTLPNVLSSGTSDFRSAYTEQTREIVAAKYEKEIMFFDYEFDQKDSVP